MEIGNGSIHPNFATLPEFVQQENLELIQKVNELHLHCEDEEVWSRVHNLITEQIAMRYFNKQQRIEPNTVLAAPAPTPDQLQLDKKRKDVFGDRRVATIFELTSEKYFEILKECKKVLKETYYDSLFTDPVLEAFQQHILIPLCANGELAYLLSDWIKMNVMYLPLGVHLLSSFKEDMNGSSEFAKYVLSFHQLYSLSEALSETTISHMTAFLSEVAQAHCRSCDSTPPPTNQPTAVMLSVKTGAGGHTAPTTAMAARLKERGWKVETIYYDTDFPQENDPYCLLGVTFEDGSPMTRNLIDTRWRMQKQNKSVCRIVQWYVYGRMTFNPDLFIDESGGDLLRKKVIPLNPQLIITTLAYHWTWRSLAYRVPGAKTLLVASDVYFHFQGLLPWYRQQSIDEKLRQIYFTTMTDDEQLLKSVAGHHDHYWSKKYPGQKIESWIPLHEGFRMDSQVSVIGAPIHPAFEAITDSQEIERLRKKWNVPEGTMSTCISRGRLGYDSDMIPALEGYRTTELLPKPLNLQVVCGENTSFYNRLVSGEFADLGPNITITPHPLRAPSDFAELRAISTIDDIKAGGGSTFEGWYLISKGSPTMLLLTPGAELWWEPSNGDAMEKWGIGRMVSMDTSKISIIKEVMEKGLPIIKNRFLEWKPLFDKTVDSLLTKVGK